MLIVSLMCPFSELTCILHLTIVRLKVASIFWRIYVHQIVLKAKFWDIRVTVLFVAVPGFVASVVVVCF